MATIAFVGTGIMGKPMVLNLLKAGHQVQVWNRTASKLADLQQAGAKICTELQQVGQGADFLICMLSDQQTCDQLLFAPQGALAQMRTQSTVIVMSSIPVEAAQTQHQRCSQLGLHYLDAPVSGGEKGAIEATLAIMVGGEQAVFDMAQPVLNAMGRAVLVGAAGCGELAKIVNQMIVASTIATVSEGILLAQQGGVDGQKLIQALAGGFADSAILQQHGQRMLQGNFKPGGKAQTQLKDTHTAVAFAKSLHLQLPVAELVDGLFTAMVASGDAELDHSALFLEIKRRNQHVT